MTGLFTPPTDVAPVTKALSASLNDLSAAVEVMDGKLPTEAEIKRGTINVGVDSGVADAYVVALPYTPSGYVEGLEVNFSPLFANTGAATINVNGLGVKSIRRLDSTVLLAADINAGAVVSMRYATATGYFHVVGTSGMGSTGATGPTGATGATGPTGPESLPVAAAGGTVDAITATFSPAITLADQQGCRVVLAGANATTTPTFAPNGLTARTIVKKGGGALVAGDLPGANAVAILQYDLANTRWELLNPSPASLVSNTFTGAQIYSDQQLSRGMTKDMGLVYLDKGNSGTSTQTLDYTAGSHQRVVVTGAHTIAATTNWPPTGNLGEILLELVNGASSAVTWPTVNWVKSDGTTTTTFSANGVTLQSSGTDWVLMWTRDAGTTVYGRVMR